MSMSKPVVWIICLTLAMIATAYSGAWLERWLEQVLVFPASVPLSKVVLAEALTKTCMAVAWLAPLVVCARRHDIGSFRLPWTWTLLLGLPILMLNLLFFGRFPLPLPVVYSVFVWHGFATGLFEELVFRGYAFRDSQTWPRLVIFTSATCFALMHLINLTHQPLATVLVNLPWMFAIGLALGIIRIASGSVAWCILIHGATNASWEFANARGAFQDVAPFVAYGVLVASLATLYLHPRLRTR